MMRPLSRREQTILDTMYSMHREFPDASCFEAGAVEVVAGPCAGSIGVLESVGLLAREKVDGRFVVRLTRHGWDQALRRRALVRSARATFEARAAG